MKFGNMFGFKERLKNIKVKAAAMSSDAAVLYERSRKKVAEIRSAMESDSKERNRVILIAISALFLLDYIMISYYIDKNVFDIFPSIPVLENRKSINIYLPSGGSREIVTEKREIYTGLEDESLVRNLFKIVARGSYFENTSENVPAKFLIKKIWLIDDENGNGRVCLIDLSPVMIEKDITVIKGSEDMFRQALEKTIIENVNGVQKVILLEKGVPGKRLWEI